MRTFLAVALSLGMLGCVSMQTVENNRWKSKLRYRAAVERLKDAKVGDDWSERKILHWNAISYWEGYTEACRQLKNGVILR